MRAKLLKKHRKDKYIRFDTKTKMYRFRYGWHMVDGSNDGEYYYDTGWTTLEIARIEQRRCIIRQAKIDFELTYFAYRRPFIKLLK